MPMGKRPKQARSRGSFTGGAIVSFLKSTAASFSVTTTSSAVVPPHGRSSFNRRNAFSGPIVSIVPPEARGAGGGRKGSRGEHRSGFRTPEPSSPKVSCIGQIKKAKACCKNGACPLPRAPKPPKSSLVKRMPMLFRRSRSRSSSRGSFFKGRPGRTAVAAAPAPAPVGLGQMKRFTSGRAAFEDFDWRDADRRASDDDEEAFVAHSAPLLVLGGGLLVAASEPRKEVNLWSRRPMAPLTPLRLP
ncbi:hypothetical protein GUJ93_ZPchr0009g491 [Zizania palustris]|uniref:Uncharacterized protein n=1 Tax=Zizania palustris TaxID=103762 RepID=A0A8J5R3G9_ZIZPA|nr:hypothetical protein GUJ93_ZPchr0009g491 [Zizania palustris]